MAELAEAGTITVGTKFDQPASACRTSRARSRASTSRSPRSSPATWASPPRTSSGSRRPSAVREEVHRGRRGRLGRGDVHDQRRAQGADHLRRAVLRRPASRSWSTPTTTTITGPESLTENPDAKVCSVTGLDARRRTSASTSPATTSWCSSTCTRKCADALRTARSQAVTTDNVILLGFVAESDGEFKLVGEQFTEEPYGIGITKGDVEFCEFINDDARRRTRTPTSRPGRRPPARSRAPRRPSCPSPTLRLTGR